LDGVQGEKIHVLSHWNAKSTQNACHVRFTPYVVFSIKHIHKKKESKRYIKNVNSVQQAEL